MVKTAEQKARDRYRAELLAGKTPRTYTETNRKILEEIRATIEAGKADVREVAERTAEAGAARIHSAKQEAVSAIDAAKRQALQEIASASSSGVTPAAQETPLIQAVAQEALGFNEPGQTTEPEQKAETHAENYPVALPGLPLAFSPPVPEVLSSRARRPLKRPLPEPDVGAGCPSEDAKVKLAHEAAVEQARRAAADRVELAERAERRERDTNERRARALQQIDSECRRCAECADMDYFICCPAADLMCSKHARRYNELV